MRVADEPVNQELIERWRSGDVLHVDGIAFPSGVVTLMTSFTMRTGTTIRCHAQPLADTSVASLLEYDESIWVPVTTLDSLGWTPAIKIVCGEGPMGNEGFVAATEPQSNFPLWVLFSSHSNPFTALSREGDHIVAEAGYGQSWRIPVAEPTRFSIADD